MGPQMLIKLRTGEQVAIDVNGYPDFTKIVDELSKWWNTWIWVSHNAAMRKRDVTSVYYLSEGYEGGQSNPV